MKRLLRNAAVVWSLLCAASTIPVDAQPAPVFSAVYTSGKDGYHTFRIPSIIVTTNRTVLAFCEGRKNSPGDTGDIDILLKRSTDGGKTWRAQQLIWSDDENTCGNPTPVVDRSTGTIWLLMCWNNGSKNEKEISVTRAGRRVFVTHSTDDGVTWTKPQEITASVKKPDWGWYATGPVNGIQLTRGEQMGRLVIPANHSETIVKDDTTNTVSRSHVFYSDDHGQTWHIGGIEDKKTNESTVAELSDGELMQNMRSSHNRNRRVVATSDDGGLTWSRVRFDEALIEPVCQASLFRYSWPDEGKSRLLFSNPASLKREKLTVRLSYDEGGTWAVSKLFYAGPSAYSCLTRLPDNSIGCLFECGKKSAYETITLARIPLSWLEEAGGSQ